MKEPQLVNGEQIFWRRDITKGWIRKKTIEIQMVTNKAVRINDDALDLSKIHRIEIADRHSRSIGSHQGYSFGVKGSGVRMMQGTGQSRSRSYGDLAFFHDDMMVFKLEDVEDASGIKRLVKAANPHIK